MAREIIAESGYGDSVTVDMHRWYAVLREAEVVIGVIGWDGTGLTFTSR